MPNPKVVGLALLIVGLVVGIGVLAWNGAPESSADGSHPPCLNKAVVSAPLVLGAPCRDKCPGTNAVCHERFGCVHRGNRTAGEPCRQDQECGNPMTCQAGFFCNHCVVPMTNVTVSSQTKSAAQKCGIQAANWTHQGTARQFINWAGNVVGGLEVYPRNDTELATVLEVLQQHNCTARPAGTGHSAAGLVTSGVGEVVISLADYTPPPPWHSNFTTTGDATATIKMGAGSTYLDLYTITRPKGYFLPTQTAGWFFSLGGTVANSVHGGVFGKSYIQAYASSPSRDVKSLVSPRADFPRLCCLCLSPQATSMRVMFANRTSTTITGSDLRYWRNSYGLLGIITAVEMTLVKRPSVYMATDSHSFKRGLVLSKQTVWSKANWDAAMQHDRTTWYAEYFFDPIGDVLQAVNYRNNSNRSGLVWKAPDSDEQSKNYAELAEKYPNLAVNGVGVPKTKNSHKTLDFL